MGERDGTLILVDDDRIPLNEGEKPMMKSVRFRTLGSLSWIRITLSFIVWVGAEISGIHLKMIT